MDSEHVNDHGVQRECRNCPRHSDGLLNGLRGAARCHVSTQSTTTLITRARTKIVQDPRPRDCRIVLAEGTNRAAMYQAKSYPIYVVIDRGGNIFGEQHGASSERALRSLLARAGMKSDDDSGE